MFKKTTTKHKSKKGEEIMSDEKINIDDFIKVKKEKKTENVKMIPDDKVEVIEQEVEEPKSNKQETDPVFVYKTKTVHVNDDVIVIIGDESTNLLGLKTFEPSRVFKEIKQRSNERCVVLGF